MKALIDADVLVYSCAFACQQETEDGPIYKGLDYVNDLVDMSIHSILAEVGADAEPALYLTGKGNFRVGAAVTKPYKGNRKAEKPFHYAYIRAYLQGRWGAVVVDGMEADDALSIHQVRELAGKNTIICSLDKDLRQIPGWHYSWENGRAGSKGPDWVEELGTINLKGGKKLVGNGMKFFYAQVLMGDAVDNYPGLDACGPVGAFKILEQCNTTDEMFKACLEAYTQKYGVSEGRTRMKEMATLAWMVRELSEDGSPKMWEMLDE